MLIVLIGYRGTGKSTIARHLAVRLGVTAFDADVEIERRSAKSIKQIFEDEGEGSFRQLEVEVVARLAQQREGVLALGGGAVMREENRRAIHGAKVVWLRAETDTILSRLAADARTRRQRPNLTTRGGREEIEELLLQRAPIYLGCADFVVDTDDKPPEQIAQEIVCWLREEAAP